MFEFIPMSSMGRASNTNSNLMSAVLMMMLVIHALGRQLASLGYIRQAKSHWSPLSWLMSPMLKLRLRSSMSWNIA